MKEGLYMMVIDRRRSRQLKNKRIRFKKKLLTFTISIGIIAISNFFINHIYSNQQLSKEVTASTITVNHKLLEEKTIQEQIDYHRSIEVELARREEIRKNTPPKGYIAITYDDGPNMTITPKILEILAKNNAKATFFVLGQNAENFPKMIAQIHEAGHEIGNHGYNHARFTKLTEAQLNEQIDKTNHTIFEITTESPTWVRPPYGEYKNINHLINYPLLLWSIDSNDWRDIPIDTIVNNIINGLEDGSIILLHDFHEKAIEITKILLPKLNEIGYKPVTVSELFNKHEIELEGGKVYQKTK
jgi:peptidoglycan/xylan/chitin deacetylase (PgdA/CDA1 family)